MQEVGGWKRRVACRMSASSSEVGEGEGGGRGRVAKEGRWVGGLSSSFPFSFFLVGRLFSFPSTSSSSFSSSVFSSPPPPPPPPSLLRAGGR